MEPKNFRPSDKNANKMMEKIIAHFKKYNVVIDILNWKFENNRFFFELKMKGNTREKRIFDIAPEIRMKLKYPVFFVHKDGLDLYLIVSESEIGSLSLYDLLRVKENRAFLSKMKLPYVVGCDVTGKVIVEDLAEMPHLLLGGSSNSGKSTGLRALITSIADIKSPSQVNFTLVDVGANDLMVFSDLPHLSCPIIRNTGGAYQAISKLVTEMARRRDLEYRDKSAFKKLPRLVLVIDEFQALFQELVNKQMVRELSHMISSLLQRGRHMKIHVVLAAQNPTKPNLHVDLANVTARIAFSCARKIYSETILDRPDAEGLMKKGELFLKSNKLKDLIRIQGSNIPAVKLKMEIRELQRRAKYYNYTVFKIDVPCESSIAESDDSVSAVALQTISEDEYWLAQTVLWALPKERVSINMLHKDFHCSWDKAVERMNKLEEWGIVTTSEGKKPRLVLTHNLKPFLEQNIGFLHRNGISDNSISDALKKR